MNSQEALCELLQRLKVAQYRFTAVTPTTHATVFARRPPPQLSLRDIFGWNRPFDAGDLEPALLELLHVAAAVENEAGKLRSKVRVATLGNDLFLHSAFPTDDPDSVFFGPDTYRFARFIAQQLPFVKRVEWLVDMGAGSGAGAIAAGRVRTPGKTTLVDVNAQALRLAAVNIAVAGVRAEIVASNIVPSGADLLIANPPYMMDAAGRSYRDGGHLVGGQVALDWIKQGLANLSPGSTMLVYTGAAYVDGEAPLLHAIADACEDARASLELSEIDPDLFGEELAEPGYEQVGRIAGIGAVIRTRDG